MHGRELWQAAFNVAKARGLCDFDASREADNAITDAAIWETIKLDAPLPVRLPQRSSAA
jgi:hypothetical protein